MMVVDIENKREKIRPMKINSLNSHRRYLSLFIGSVGVPIDAIDHVMHIHATNCNFKRWNVGSISERNRCNTSLHFNSLEVLTISTEIKNRPSDKGGKECTIVIGIYIIYDQIGIEFIDWNAIEEGKCDIKIFELRAPWWDSVDVDVFSIHANGV